MPHMNRKQFIKTVSTAIHQLKEQGQICLDDGGNCVYLNDQNHSCIVGLMMPDTETRNIAVDIEGDVTRLMDEPNFIWTDQFDKDQLHLMGRLQNIHDDNLTGVTFEEKITSMQQELGTYVEGPASEH